jgi:hypothetical protein
MVDKRRNGGVDSRTKRPHNDRMSTTSTIPAEVMAKMQDAADRAAKGIRDPEAMRKACDEMDQMREELRRRIGTVEMAVELIRDARNP